MLCMFDTGIISFRNRYLTWKISNFNSLPVTVGCEIRSPEFVYEFSRYTLVIWPRGQKGNEEWFGICLYKYGALRSGDSVQFTITGRLRDIKTCTVECSENNIFRQAKFMEWSDFCALGSEITPNGCLTIICRMSESKLDEQQSTQKDGIPEEFSYSTKDPAIKCQLGDYHSLDPLSIASAVKLRYIESQTSSYQVPEFDSSSPSTVKSFYNTPSIENSSENAPDLLESINSDLKMPYAVTTSDNAFSSTFTRGFSRANKANNPELMQDSMGNSPQNSTSESENVSSNKNTNLVDNSNTSKDTVTACSVNSSATSGMWSCSCSLQTANSEIESDEKSDAHKENEEVKSADVSSSVHTCDDVVANLNLRKNETESAIYIPIGLRIMSQHYKNLYLEGKDFDLRIIMAGKEFKVHKAILKTRSPVFARMLSEDADRNSINIISIDPFGACDSSIFHDFLLYIYSGELENLCLRNVSGLYFAACNFERQELKEACVEFLKMSLAIDIIADIFRFIRDESELLEIARIFLARNLELILKTDEWKQFMTEERDRAIELSLQALQIGYVKTIK